MNVNGLAGSIELYLGRDVLEGADGKLTPVQWRGYSQSLGRYQGELLNKAELLDRFEEIAKAWRANKADQPGRDWSGLRAILDRLRSAFS